MLCQNVRIYSYSSLFAINRWQDDRRRSDRFFVIIILICNNYGRGKHRLTRYVLILNMLRIVLVYFDVILR